MHGLLHVVLRSMVVEIGGDEVWEKVIDKLGLPGDDGLLELRIHDDAVTIAGATAACEMLGVPLEEGLRLFGEHFVAFLETTGYIETLAGYGNDMVEILCNIDMAHRRLEQVYPGCTFPHFHVSPPKDRFDTFRMSYASTRGELLAPLAEGILVKVAKTLFNQLLTMRRTPEPLIGHHCTWQVLMTPLPEDESTAKPRPSPSRHEKRAASMWHSALAACWKGNTSTSDESKHIIYPEISRSPSMMQQRDMSQSAAASFYRGPLGANAALNENSIGNGLLSRVTPTPTPALQPGEQPASNQSVQSSRSASILVDSVHDLRSNLTAVSMKMPPLNVWGEFKNKGTEDFFRNTQLRDRYLKSSIRLALAFAIALTPFVAREVVCFESAVTALNLISPPGKVSFPAQLTLFLYIPTLLVALVAYAATRLPKIPLSLVEWAIAVWQTVVIVRITVLSTSRLNMYKRDRYGGISMLEHGDEFAGSKGNECDAIFAIGFIFSAAAFAPLQLRRHFAFTLVSIAAVAAAEIAYPIIDMPSAQWRDLVVFGVLQIVVCRSMYRTMIADRTQFHFYSSVLNSAGRWRRLKRQEVDEHLRASRAEAATTARSNLIRVVMHDLRSPLLAVCTVAESLADLPSPTAVGEGRVQASIDALRTCSKLMEGIVSDMLDFERIDSGRMTLVRRPFDLTRLLKDAEVAFAPLVARKGITLEFEELPYSARSLRFIGDARRLLQCLSNGLSNASKFTDPGGAITVRVWTSPHASEGWTRLHLAVVDNGIGLSREEHEVLLKGEVFTQVGKGQLQGRGGTGLGLNIVRHILRLHDESELFINSKGLWQGTTFEMRINLHHTHATSTNLSSADQDFLQQRTTKSAREQVASRFSHGQGAQRANSSSHSSVDAVSQSPFSNLLGYHGPSASPPSHRASHKAEDRVTSGLELSSEFSFSQGAVESRCSVLHVEDDLMLQVIRTPLQHTHTHTRISLDGPLNAHTHTHAHTYTHAHTRTHTRARITRPRTHTFLGWARGPHLPLCRDFLPVRLHT